MILCMCVSRMLHCMWAGATFWLAIVKCVINCGDNLVMLDYVCRCLCGTLCFCVADCPAMSFVLVCWHRNPNINKLSWAINYSYNIPWVFLFWDPVVVLGPFEPLGHPATSPSKYFLLPKQMNKLSFGKLFTTFTFTHASGWHLRQWIIPFSQ